MIARKLRVSVTAKRSTINFYKHKAWYSDDNRCIAKRNYFS